MSEMKINIRGHVGPDGHLRLDVPTKLASADVDVTVTIQTSNGAGHGAGTRCDFSDLAGKLIWSGDAVAQQRGLRDEW